MCVREREREKEGGEDRHEVGRWVEVFKEGCREKCN